MSTQHKKKESEVMLWLSDNYPQGRCFRFDNGQAYAKFSVLKCIGAIAKKISITKAKSHLITITYGTIGFPDLVFGMGTWVLGIEVKIGKDKQSEGQKNMQDTFNMMGWGYVVLDDKSPVENQLKHVCEMMKEYKR